MNTAELPEYQIFSILKSGSDEALGPYSQNEIVELLNQGSVRSSDLIFYEGLESWQPLGEIFELHQAIANFEDDGQDHAVVAEVFSEMTKILSDDEDIFYIAIQDKPAIRLKGPSSVMITEKRICIVHHKLTGKLDYEAYFHDEIHVAAVRVKMGADFGAFSLLLKSGDRIEVDRLPVAQLKRLEQLAGELSTDQVSVI